MSNFEAGRLGAELLAACRAAQGEQRAVNARDAGEKVTVCFYRFKRMFDVAMQQLLDEPGMETATPTQPEPRVYR